MKPDHRNPAPKDWGKDHLSKFLDTADQNRYAAFALDRAGYEKIRRIDDLFMAPSLSV